MNRPASGTSPIELLVLEAGHEVGGKIGTVGEDGFLCETGPNGFLDNEPATLRLVEDLGLTTNSSAARTRPDDVTWCVTGEWSRCT